MICCFCPSEAIPWPGAAADVPVLCCAACQTACAIRAHEREQQPVVVTFDPILAHAHRTLVAAAAITSRQRAVEALGLSGPTVGDRIH